MLKGLLDTLNSEEGQFALSMLAAAGPQAQPMSFGQRLAGVMQQQSARKTAEEDRALKRSLIDAQMQEVLAQADERKAKVLKEKQALAEAQRIREVIGNAFSPVSPSQALAAGGAGPTPEAAALVGQQKPVNYQALIAQGVPVELVKGLAESRNFGRDKVARTVEGMEGGRPATLQFDDYGNRVGAAIPKAVEMKLQDLGGSVVGLDPYSGQPTGVQLRKSATPDALLSNSLGRDRLNFDIGQANNKPPQFHDGFWLTPPSKDNPTGTAVKIPGFDKPLNEQQGNATNFLGRMRNASEVINQIEGGAYTDTKGTTRSLTPDKVSGAIAPSFVESASGVVPFIGDDLASRARSGNDLRSVYRQAQVDWVTANLRKESGAVIGAEEMDNEIKKYFPQRGDSAEVVRRKAESRAQAQIGMARQAGPGASIETVRQGAESMPKSRIVKLDDGSSVNATLGADGKYYVTRNGKTYRVED